MPDLQDAVSIADALHRANQQLMDELDQEEKNEGLAVEFNKSHLRQAQTAYTRHDYLSAMQSFDSFFSKVDLTEKSVSCMAILWYAVSLAKAGDKRAKEILEIGQQRLRAEFSLNHLDAALAWWCAAEVHALLGDASAALVCLRESYAEAPKHVCSWWFSSASESFRSIKYQPDLVAFEKEIAPPAAKSA